MTNTLAIVIFIASLAQMLIAWIDDWRRNWTYPLWRIVLHGSISVLGGFIASWLWEVR